MTDEQMDARLRRAGEAWRAAVDAAPQGQAVLEPEPLAIGATARAAGRRRRVGLLASAAVVAAALVAGGAVLITGLGGTSTPEASTATLTGTRWKLVRIVGSTGQDTPVVGDVTLQIDEQHHLTGSDGCNSLSGDVQVTGSVIRMGSVSVTERACTDDRLMASSVLIDTDLNGDLHWSIRGDELSLSNPRSGDTLVYHAVTPPTRSTDPRDLTGIRWQLNTIETGSGRNSTAQSVTGVQTLQVGTALRYDAGCNVDGADVQVGQGTMQIGASGGTIVLCTGALAAEERAINAVLQGSVRWFVEGGDQLTITKDGVGTLVYNRGANPSDVLDTTWTLSSISPAGATGQFRFAPYSLRMSAGEVRLRTPCHDYQGHVTLDPGTVAFTGVHDVGGNDCRTQGIPGLLQLLDESPLWSLENGRFTLSAGDTVATFVGDATPVAQLLGRTWTLTGWQSPSHGAMARTDQPSGALAEIRFDSAGRITIKHRCYVDKGAVQLDEGTLDISGVTLAEALPCPAVPNQQQAEQTSDSLVDSVLTGGSTWSINGTDLVIAKGDVTLDFSG